MYLSNYSVYMEYHKRKPGEPGKSQGNWVISNLTLNIFRLSIYRKYQNTQQQLDITAVPENKVCFKYHPRCNKFLFLPFIRPITVQDCKLGRGGKNQCKVPKWTKTVCIPFPPHCCPTGCKCVSDSISWSQKQLSAQARVWRTVKSCMTL